MLDCLSALGVHTIDLRKCLQGSDAAWDVKQSNGKQSSSNAWLKPLLYGISNIVAATSIVFANKLVMSNYGFRFTTALTLLHTLTTFAGMLVFARVGIFQVKTVSKLAVGTHILILSSCVCLV